MTNPYSQPTISCVSFSLAILLTFFSGTSGATGSIEAKVIVGIPYYFPKSDICTMMIDYQLSAASLGQAKGVAKSILLVRSMLNEFASNGAQKCKGAPTIRMLAVMVSGKDSYGRPDFGSRTNLLKLEGHADKLSALAHTHGPLSLPTIRGTGSLDVYWSAIDSKP